ncbi:MAG TPA: class I SAM-dependent methyltransferase [Gemmatimonadales bacterium]|jgi:SAM-dependent methyltransferase
MSDYGLDAPGVVRNLALVAIAGIVLALLVWLRVLPPAMTWHLPGGIDLKFALLGLGLGPGLGCAVAAGAMVWGSRVGKVRQREQLLDAVPWTGSEQVLDIGCGRGLMLVGAAKRLQTGVAIGIDLWRAEDLAGNRPQAALDNAEAEGVGDRVRVETADMRRLPFPPQSFDRVVSRAAIHNLDDPAARAEAIREIARVLRAGGFAIIDDIRHLAEYNEVFRQAGCTPVRRLDSPAASLAWSLLSFGALRPGAWLIQR